MVYNLSCTAVPCVYVSTQQVGKWLRDDGGLPSCIAAGDLPLAEAAARLVAHREPRQRTGVSLGQVLRSEGCRRHLVRELVF